jgi:beta-glucanase (GH16 family)
MDTPHGAIRIGRWPSLVGALAIAAASATPCVVHAADWKLVWSDEFQGAALDPAKWSIAQDCWGGGNRERQCYTADAVSVSGGELHLTASSRETVGYALPEERRAESPRTVLGNYASGKVATKGKASFRFGRIEVRARFPVGQGLWSGIWMLPEHDNYGAYPLSGEIDIAEAVNLVADPHNAVHGSRHFGQTANTLNSFTSKRRLADPAGFHVYALEWTPKTMTWFADGVAYGHARTVKPFDQRYHLILNLAEGGHWPEGNGDGIDLRSLPATVAVDWVRVYEQAN